MVLGRFSWFWLSPWALQHTNLDNTQLPTLWLVSCLSIKTKSYQKSYVESRLEECVSLEPSPDLNPIKNFSMGLMGHLQAKSKSQTLVPDFTNALVAEWEQIPPVEAFQEDCSKLGHCSLLTQMNRFFLIISKTKDWCIFLYLLLKTLRLFQLLKHWASQANSTYIVWNMQI